MLAIGLAYLAYGENTIREKSEELKNIEAEITKLTPANTEALNNDKKYNAIKASVLEIDGFIRNQSLEPMEFISALAQSLPREVMLENIEQKYQFARITGHIKASAEIATGIVYNFEQSLGKNPIISKNFKEIAISNVVKDGQNERLNFEITFAQTKKK